MKMGILVLAVAVANSCLAAVTTISDSTRILAVDESQYTVSTLLQEQFPSELGQPLFWLDCSDRANWEFEPDTMRPVNIPCKVVKGYSSDRFLTTTKAEGTSVFNLTPPEVVTDEFGSYLDFGAPGSYKGLLFNGVPSDGEGSKNVNILKGIGTIVAVYNADQGGGYLLGGAIWQRGAWDGTVTSKLSSYMAGILVSNTSYVPRLGLGVLRHDGVGSTPFSVGFKGTWEVVSTCARDRSETANAEKLPFDHDFYDATGIGINVTNSDKNSSGGGMKIAEMILFDRKLEIEELEKVEAYLQRKWFASRPYRGTGGDAHAGIVTLSTVSNLGTATVARVDVPAGERLHIDRIRGGRAPARDSRKPALVKSGAGALVIDGAANYNGTVELRGGSLDFERRAIPEAGGLPGDMLGWFDVSRPSSCDIETLDGKKYVAKMRNLATGQQALYQEKYEITLEQSDPALRPLVREDALGEGLHSLDFGPLSSTGSYMNFYANEANVTVPAVTVIAAWGIQDWNGSLLSGTFKREYPGTAYRWSSGHIVSPNSLHGWNASGTTGSFKNGEIYIDGIRKDVDEDMFDYPGYITYAHVAPIGNDGSLGANSVGFTSNKSRGGMRLMEIIMYRRILSEREILDVQAYLSKKWFGRATPGYERCSDDLGDDIQKLSVSGDCAINVPAGASVTIGHICVEAGKSLTKTGAGVLNVRAGSGLESGIAVAGGDVVFSGLRTVSQSAVLASAPSMHLDASNASTMEIEVSGEKKLVSTWYSTDFDNLAFVPKFYNSTGNSPCAVAKPWISNDVVLNGKSVVDFGEIGVETPISPMMSFARGLDSVRSVYVVIKFKGGCGHLLGSAVAGDCDGQYSDFSRAGTLASSGLFYWNTGSQANGAKANQQIFINGLTVANTVAPADEFQLVEVHTTGGAHASALACDQFRDHSAIKPRNGGVMIAEAVLYERELTEREKVATRNYLMKKWFGSEEHDLPAKTAENHIFWKLEYDCESGEASAVDGNVVLADNAVVNLCNFSDSDFGKYLTIAKGASASFGDNSAKVLIDGSEIDSRMKYKFKVSDSGELKVKVSVCGTVIICN